MKSSVNKCILPTAQKRSKIKLSDKFHIWVKIVWTELKLVQNYWSDTYVFVCICSRLCPVFMNTVTSWEQSGCKMLSQMSAFLILKLLSLVAPFRLQYGTMQSNYNADVATSTVRFQCTERLYFLHSMKFDRRVYTFLWEKKIRFYIWNCKSPVFTLNFNEIQYGTDSIKHFKPLLCTCGKE